MKRLGLLLLGMFIASGAYANFQTDGPLDDVRLDLGIVSGHGENAPNIVRPRSIAIVPISGHYNAGVVYLEFLSDLGQVAIEIVNNSTGEQWFELADSADGGVAIEISAEQGDYTVFIETESGATFSGNFTL